MPILDAFESFVGVNFWTMLFAWCNLAILYFFLRKILFGPIKKMIDSRQKEIDDMYDSAESSQQAAMTLTDSRPRRRAGRAAQRKAGW